MSVIDAPVIDPLETIPVLPVEPAPRVTREDVLRYAAKVIDQRGWCRGTVQELDGRVCAVGAIGHAVMALSYMGTDYVIDPSLRAVHRAALLIFDHDSLDNIADYNDGRDLTPEQGAMMAKDCLLSLADGTVTPYALRWRPHDAGFDGSSLSGEQQKAQRGDR